ncbi:MAG: hypothetical protein HFJ43_04390 [Clostridia bacterium]|nr:hypothetical protein [Clostridia bacterium]
MNLEKLYDLAEKENIHIKNFFIKELNGIYVCNKNYKVIGLNYKILDTVTKEKCTLAEELGHYYYDATYNLNSDSQLISKQEYKSLKWRSLNCVTLKSILSCFYKRNM